MTLNHMAHAYSNAVVLISSAAKICLKIHNIIKKATAYCQSFFDGVHKLSYGATSTSVL